MLLIITGASEKTHQQLLEVLTFAGTGARLDRNRDIDIGNRIMAGNKSITKKLALLFKQARIALQRDGLNGLVCQAGLFTLKPIYRHGIHYLYQKEIEDSFHLGEGDCRPDIDGLTLRVILSNQEADELETEGFEFRSYPTDWNIGLTLYRKWLDGGAIAFCVFAGYELAAICWVITSQQTHDRLVPRIPVKIDYSNREAFSRGAWTNQKYRGVGLFRYNSAFNTERFLARSGFTTLRTSAPKHHLVGQRLLTGLGYTKYAEGHESKWIFGKWAWKEMPINQDEASDLNQTVSNAK